MADRQTEIVIAARIESLASDLNTLADHMIATLKRDKAKRDAFKLKGSSLMALSMAEGIKGC